MRKLRPLLLLASVWLAALGCTTLQSDYAKSYVVARPTFSPRTVGAFSTVPHYYAGPADASGLKRLDAAKLAAFGEGTEKTAAIEFHYEPAAIGADRRWEGFDVIVMPLDDKNRPVKKAGGMVMELYRFNPDVASTIGQKLLEWDVSEEELLPTWETNSYHFHLSWWKTKPNEQNFYVVMVVTFVAHDGRTFTMTKAPVSITQSRYEKP